MRTAAKVIGATFPKWTVLLVLLASTVQAQTPSGDGPEARSVLDNVEVEIRAQLRAAAREASAYVADDKRLGLYLSATQVPEAGRILIERRIAGTSAPERSWCSGVLVSPRRVLTAAHCFCERQGAAATGEAECRASLGELAVKVYFPTAGLFDVVVPPDIHPRYRSSTLPIQPDSTVLADLAVLRLASQVPITPAAVGAQQEAGKYVLAGFGAFAFLDLSEVTSKGYPAKIRFQPGVKQLSGASRVLRGVAGCRDWSTADSFCTRHFADPVAEPSEQTAAVCGGDSGAPFMRRDGRTGRLAAVGVASFYSPDGDPQCDTAQNKRSHFIDVGHHAPWIRGAIQDDQGAQETRDSDCMEGIVTAGVLNTTAGPGVIAVTSFSDDRGRNHPHPSFEMSTDTGSCQKVEGFGVGVCTLPSAGRFSLKLPEGRAQISICARPQ